MILTDDFARVLVEDRHRDLRSTPRRRWLRFTRQDPGVDRDSRNRHAA